jgi:metal-responsive CopG/Arc/MetJ family transcriptional regulator
MRDTVTISIPREFKKQIDALVYSEGISRSVIIRKSIADYLWEHRYRNLRKRLMAKASKKGVFTDQDVFDRVS